MKKYILCAVLDAVVDRKDGVDVCDGERERERKIIDSVFDWRN